MRWPCLTRLVRESQEGLRQSCAGSTPRYKGTMESWRSTSRLPISPDRSLFARLSGRVTNQKGVRDAKALGGGEKRALASRLKKDGTRLIRAGQLREEAQCAACKGCSCFNTATLPRWTWSFSSAAASSEHPPPPCTMPAYTCPFTTNLAHQTNRHHQLWGWAPGLKCSLSAQTRR